MPARMAANLAALGLLLGGMAQAQEATRATNPPTPYPVLTSPEPPQVYRYTKPAGTTLSPPENKTYFLEKPAGTTYGPLATPAGLTPQRSQSPRGAQSPPFDFQSTAYQSPKVRPGTVSPEPAGASPAVAGPGRAGEAGPEYYIPLEPPGPQKLFKLDSEAALQERFRQEAREKPNLERLEFPDEPVVGTGAFVARTFAGSKMLVEPNYVCYGRLFFEDKNSERYGWDLGPIQPIVSAALFYKDVAFLPYHAFTNPFRCYECSAGYCLPGDPVPYLLYPPGLSLTGAVMEAGIGVALFAIFP